MRVVVTGATSMIGVALIKECIKSGDEVLAIIREGTGRMERLPVSELIKIEYADLGTLDTVRGDGKPYDVFYHFAWGHTGKNERDNPLLQEENIHSALLAVKLANRLNCKKFIGAGSQAEYGQINGVIDANTRPNPVISYGIAKLSANMMSRRMCEQLGLIHIWGRIFSVYGTNDNEGTMLDYAIKQFIKGEKASFSAATQIWNYLYEDDAGKMFYLLGEKDVEGGIYLIANNESKILKKYIEEMIDIYGEEVSYEFAPTGANSTEINLNVDINKTIKAIEYIPQITFAEGINNMINSLKLRENNIV